MAMTVEQAANVLGISPNATKAEISAAYRKKVAQYHPDANRDKSPAEQAQAEKMFKAVALAKKTMTNPDAAQKANAATTQASPTRPQQSTSYTRPQSSTRSQTTYSDPRTQYNQAKTFMDNVQHVKDKAESQLSDLYETDVEDIYKKSSDIFRFTPTMLVSLAFAIWNVFSIISNPLGFDSFLTPHPSVMLLGLIVFKMMFFDLMIVYYIYRFLSKYKLSWLFVTGIDCIAMAIVSIVVFATSQAPVHWMLWVLVAIGIVLVMASLIMRSNPVKEER